MVKAHILLDQTRMFRPVDDLIETAAMLGGACLSCEFNPLPDAKVAHDPGQQETQGQVPVQRRHGHVIRQP